MKFHFEIIPPEIYANTNQDQDFFATIEDNQWGKPPRNYVINEVEKGSQKESNMKVISLNVKPNQVRQVHKLGKLEKIEFPNYFVPVMFHYEGGTLRITATQGEKIVWKKSITYQLPPQYFPKAKMSSKWKQVDEKHVKCEATFDEIIKEEWSYLGPIHHYIRFTDDYLVAVDLGIQLALNNQTLEPMTYYTDRVHALKNLTLYLDQSLLMTTVLPKQAQPDRCLPKEISPASTVKVNEDHKPQKPVKKIQLKKCQHVHK